MAINLALILIRSSQSSIQEMFLCFSTETNLRPTVPQSCRTYLFNSILIQFKVWKILGIFQTFQKGLAYMTKIQELQNVPL